ncbi:MAG: acyl carrier protein [Thermodesulfobacteriota bacterium]
MINEGQIRAAMKAAGVDINVDKIAVDTSLRDAGMDSLDMFNLFLEIETAFQIKIPDEAIENLQTIEEIRNYLNQSVR